jgi:DNA-directed RNA polymerase specialized sigma24 family protein
MTRANILVARIERVIASLDPMTREAFLMLRFENLSYARIGHELGISVVEVEQHIACAIYSIDKGVTEPEQSDRH